MPQSSKVVVLDNDLSLSAGFEALLENGCEAAPVYDTPQKEFVDLLTLGDFLAVLVAIIRQLEVYSLPPWSPLTP